MCQPNKLRDFESYQRPDFDDKVNIVSKWKVHDFTILFIHFFIYSTYNHSVTKLVTLCFMTHRRTKNYFLTLCYIRTQICTCCIEKCPIKVLVRLNYVHILCDVTSFKRLHAFWKIFRAQFQFREKYGLYGTDKTNIKSKIRL
jgi:hypothetical protein